jgi:very-short-patch-repair endonuclease
MPSLHQQRLISMLDYLEEWDKLSRTPVFDIAAHQALIIWQQDVAALPGFALNSSDETGEVWLTLDRLRPTKPPSLPAELVPWVVVSDDPFREPHRRESIPHPTEPKQEIEFDDAPEREGLFASYIEKSWAEWSTSEQPKRRSISHYDKLFNLLQTIETEGAETALELVWGIGMAVWKPDKQPTVRHPILCRLVEIDPIGRDMALRIRPRDVPTLLETDIFAAMENPGLPMYERAARTILDNADIQVTPFDEASFEQILSGAAGTLDRQARYWPREPSYEQGVVPSPSNHLTITNSWVIFARRKGTNFLIDDVRRLKAKVETEDVPEGAPTALVETPSGAAAPRRASAWRGMSSTGFTSGWAASSNLGIGATAAAPSELFFPKPFNAEQIQIVDRLENSDGVVVQGPPGTGKTHTIANVICHYLAQGKRVLVTSKGEPALAVLRDQLPPSIQHLTVSLLTSERDGLKQLEQGIAKITTEVTTLNLQEVTHQIQRLHSRIGQTHQSIAEIDRELATWAKKNIDQAPESLGGLRPSELAKAVLEQTSAHEWFPDALDSRPEHEIQFSLDEVSSLLAARDKVGGDIIYLNTQLPDTESVPTAPQLADLHRLLLEYDELNQSLDDEAVERLKAPSKDDLSNPERLHRLLVRAEQAAKMLREAAAIRRCLTNPWINWLKAGFEAKYSSNAAFTVVKQRRSELDGLAATRRQFIGVSIEWTDEWDDDEHLMEGVRNAAAGKSAFGMLSFGRKTAKDRFQKIRLNGQSPKSPEDWRWIESHVALRKQTRIMIAGWNALRADCPAPQLPTTPAEALRVTEEILAQMEMAERWVAELAPNLESEVKTVFSDVSTDGIVDDPDRMERLAKAIDLRVRRKRLENAKTQASRLIAFFQQSSLPLFEMAKELVENELGNPELNGQSLERKWSAVLDSLSRLRALQGSLETIHRVTLAIKHNGAPLWASQLRISPKEGATDTILRPDWAASWRWRRQFGHLLLIDGRQRMLEASKKRIILQNELGKSYASMVEQLTWLKLKETLDQDRGLMSALQQYMAAIRGIGAGTGARAVRHRTNARKAMLRANEAVRCWIMPHWRISESIPSELALFDLVILDEASQSDMWALPAILRGKKLLVVGDNKQVSPLAIGMSTAIINGLHARFLRDLPFGDVLSPERSVYDLASVMFASDLVRLREHFRCVEPIIEFSNQLCYGGEIRCLRVPTASERITPPLVDVYVKDGARDGRGKMNRAEAQAIVNEIKFLTRDPQFAKRSIGVVSLLGGDQAKIIRELLVAEVGEEAILAHQIRCGDAMTFQGREADIILISMVSDGDSVRALSGSMYEQRFNVAVSRARDRIYLFRSFKREDLKENDLRSKLVAHFVNPLKRDVKKKGRDRCESDFELSVYDRLNEAGYRILPQVSAGGYRIDLVVEGTAGRRLAVECDGDHYHGPDVWMDDLQRQRTLERAGWRFWRCWGSSWVRDPDGCFRSLVEALQEQGVDPIGGMDTDLNDVAEYREVYGFPPEELPEVENGGGTVDPDVSETEDEDLDAEGSSFGASQDAEQTSQMLVRRKVDDVDDALISQTIQIVLRGSPNQTCTVESLATKVLKSLRIRTRSGPRAEFAKRVRRVAGKLERRGVLERYTATNERYRLLAPELL